MNAFTPPNTPSHLVDQQTVWRGGTALPNPLTVRIVGLDYRFPESTGQLEERLAPLLVDGSPDDGELEGERADLTLVLAHAPSSFRHLVPLLEQQPGADGVPTLTLSGHLHGGQLDLLRLGIDWTVLRLSRRPMHEHGLWRRGRHHLYSSRGFGHYGFPLRIGVPAELSVLEIEVAEG